jgi:hypothetical protein
MSYNHADRFAAALLKIIQVDNLLKKLFPLNFHSWKKINGMFGNVSKNRYFFRKYLTVYITELE